MSATLPKPPSSAAGRRSRPRSAPRNSSVFCVEIKFRGASLLAIDATPARWRDDAGSSQVVLAARQPTTKLPSGSLVRRGTRKARLDVDANDMNQEAARRSWDAAEALCAVADAASPES